VHSAGQKDGIWAWDYIHKNYVLLISLVLSLLGDNPMQSELSCHSGMHARCHCHVCLIEEDGSKDKDGNSPMPADGALSWPSSLDSRPATPSSPALAAPSKKHSKKSSESPEEMYNRLCQFMRVIVLSSAFCVPSNPNPYILG
jgi:hypothetical protein